MKNDITTIPVNDVFDPKEGCPICRLRGMLEQRTLDFILGPAMMEPDIRIRTNDLGFCYTHFSMMAARHNRLQLALMLDSHLAQLQKRIFGEGKPALLRPSDSKRLYQAARVTETCYVCEQVERSMQHMLNNILHLYEQDKSFRRLFAEQPVFCLPHYGLLLEHAEQSLPKKVREEFSQALTAVTQNYLQELHTDVRHFCDMFDYRNNSEDADWGNSRDAIERSIRWLTTRGD